MTHRNKRIGTSRFLGSWILRDSLEVASETLKNKRCSVERLRKKSVTEQLRRDYVHLCKHVVLRGVNYETEPDCKPIPILVATSLLGWRTASSVSLLLRAMQEKCIYWGFYKGRATYAPWQWFSFTIARMEAQGCSEMPTLSILKKGGGSNGGSGAWEAEVITRTTKQKRLEWS
jgi:hypothetical protein